MKDSLVRNSASPDSAMKARLPLFADEPFEQGVAILMALVAVLAGVIALMESNVSAQADGAYRQAQQLAIQTVSVQARGEIEVGYAWFDVYQHWLEWDTLARAAKDDGELMAVSRYQAVRDRARLFSPLLDAPYFDPVNDDNPDIRAFEAETYLVETTILTERFAAAIANADSLKRKQNAHFTQLLFLAITLFLFGLSTTIAGRLRWLFVGIGSVIAIWAVVWMVVVYTAPVDGLPDDAIVSYAEGVGLAHQQAQSAAVDAFDRSLAIAPTYANAYTARGTAHVQQGNFDHAIADYLAARALGRTDMAVLWNLGWTYYVAGEFAHAIETTKSALAGDETQVGLQFNLGLMQLAQGDLDRAQESYMAGLAQAAQQVADARALGTQPPSSLWWYLNTAALDLDHFRRCLADGVCIDAPPIDSLNPTADALATTQHLRRQMKNSAVALEYLGQLPTESVRANIEAPTIEMIAQATPTPAAGRGPRLTGALVQSQQGEDVESGLIRTASDQGGGLLLAFDHMDIQPGQLFTLKVYRDGQELTSLRLVEAWTRPENGQATLPLAPTDQFNFTPGHYQVELYLEGQMIQELAFSLDESREVTVFAAE